MCLRVVRSRSSVGRRSMVGAEHSGGIALPDSPRENHYFSRCRPHSRSAEALLPRRAHPPKWRRACLITLPAALTAVSMAAPRVGLFVCACGLASRTHSWPRGHIVGVGSAVGCRWRVLCVGRVEYTCFTLVSRQQPLLQVVPPTNDHKSKL